MTLKEWLKKEGMIAAIATISFEYNDPRSEYIMYQGDWEGYPSAEIMLTPEGELIIKCDPGYSLDVQDLYSNKNIKWDHCYATVWCKDGWWGFQETGEYYCDGWHHHPKAPEMPEKWEL